MKDLELISPIQMSIIFLSFLIGSAMVNIPSPLINSAGNSAWVSLLIGNVIGILLLACILYLNRQFKGLTLIDYTRKMFGNGVAVLLGIPFTITLFLMVANISIDVSYFMNNTLMPNTPLFMFNFFIILLAALTAYTGIEVMGRMFTMLMIFLIGTFFLLSVFMMPLLDLQNLLPLFPEGFKPVLHGTYIVYGFPYAEVILFSMLLHLLATRKKDC